MSDEAIDVADDVTDEVMEDVADEGGEEALDAGADESEEQAEHQEPVPDPAKATKPKEEKKPPPRTYKVKVNGKEQDVPADDLDKAAAALGVDPQALLGGTRMFRAANERFQKAAEIEKQARATLEALKARPRDALREMLGEENFARVAIEAVQELMTAESLTPEQRRIRELEAAQAKTEREKAEQAKQREQQQATAYEADVAKRLDTEITQALTSGKLPKDPYVVKRLAAMVDAHLASGGNPDELSFSDFVPLVQDEIRKEHEAFLGSLSGEDVITRFPSLAEKVRKAYADRVSGRRRVPEVQSGEIRTKKREDGKVYGSIGAALRDW